MTNPTPRPDPPPPPTRPDLERELDALGVDLVGFAAVADLERDLPAELRPSTLIADPPMHTLVVFGKRTLLGVGWSRHLPSKQLAGGRALRFLDHAAETLVRRLEDAGHPSLPVSMAALDFERRTPLDVVPAGQGSTLLRHAAVAAGLGTFGLNGMVLTPRFGPRLHFGGVLTTLALEPGASGAPIAGELCLGLEQCGRCAAVCPQQAIPRRAPLGAPLADVRGLDRAACARSSHPFGFAAFVEHLRTIVATKDGDAMWQRMRGRTSGEMWAEMAMMKEAALTGCSDCLEVCPVGEDYARLQATPHRQQDLPAELERTIAGGYVEVVHLGPSIRRQTHGQHEGKR